jgi:hypothetical protein
MARDTGADEAKGAVEVESVVKTLTPRDCPIVSVTVYTENVAEVKSCNVHREYLRVSSAYMICHVVFGERAPAC